MLKFTNQKFNVRSFTSISNEELSLCINEYDELISVAIHESTMLVVNEYEKIVSEAIHESMMLAGNQATMLIFKLTGIMHTIDGDMYYYEGKGHESRKVYIKKNGR